MPAPMGTLIIGNFMEEEIDNVESSIHPGCRQH
jgi:hypothetical protein